MTSSSTGPTGDQQGGPPADTATVAVQIGRSVAVVRVAGKIDIATVGELRAALDAAVSATHGRVLVDLGAVTFMDVSGVGALAAAADLLQQGGYSELVVVDPSPAAWRVLHLTGLDEVITIRTGPPATPPR